MANIQKQLDIWIDRALLRFIPTAIKPNFFTYLRILSVPLLFILLYKNLIILASVIFALSACTDFIDGALARTRGQITDLGKVLDPIADKMLITTVLVYIGFEYLIVKIFLVVIAFEIVSIFASSLLATYLGTSVGANVFGKIKMILQSLAVGLFLLGLIVNNKSLILSSEYILFIALIFALLSAFEQLRRRAVIKLEKVKEEIK